MPPGVGVLDPRSVTLSALARPTCLPGGGFARFAVGIYPVMPGTAGYVGEWRIVERAEARLAGELRRLYAAAGRPELAEVVRWGADRRPVVWFSVSSLSDWLRPHKVAVPSEGALLALVEFLCARAERPVPRQWWAQLRRAAWRESHPGARATPA